MPAVTRATGLITVTTDCDIPEPASPGSAVVVTAKGRDRRLSGLFDKPNRHAGKLSYARASITAGSFPAFTTFAALS
jgi:hypothetical protein